MRSRFIPILALLFVFWIGYHLLVSFRERSRVESLPKNFQVLGPSSAKGGLAEAKRIASHWDAKCQLQAIFLAFGGDDEGMSKDGIPIAPSGWTYRFFSSTRGWFLDLTLWPDGRCGAASFNGINYLDTRPLPHEFLDSTTALSIAEELYGNQYREKGKLSRLPAKLTTWRSSFVGPVDPVAHRAIWQIEYLTRRDQDWVHLCLILDAATGEELCAVELVNSKDTVLTNNYRQ